MASLNSIPKTETKRKSFFSGSIPVNDEVKVEIKEVVQAGQVSPPVAGLVQISIDQLIPHEHQSRRVFEAEQLEELTRSITANGVITPLKVVKKGNRYEVASGERRLRAAKSAGLSHLPCILIDEKKGILESVIENLQRENLNLFEEGRDYSKLLETKVFDSRKEMSDNLGISLSRVSECLSFYENIPSATQDKLIKEGKVTRQALRNILKNDPDKDLSPSPPVKYFLNIQIIDGKVTSKVLLPESLSENLKNEIQEEIQKIWNN